MELYKYYSTAWFYGNWNSSIFLTVWCRCCKNSDVLLGSAKSNGRGLNTILYLKDHQWKQSCINNLIALQSEGLAWAIYKSHWIFQSHEMKKNILIVILRCQKPIVMKVDGFFSALSLNFSVTVSVDVILFPLFKLFVYIL